MHQKSRWAAALLLAAVATAVAVAPSATAKPAKQYRIALVTGALVVTGAVTSAAAAGWLEKSIYLIGPRYDGVLPPCEAGSTPSRTALRRRKAGSGTRTCRSSALSE